MKNWSAIPFPLKCESVLHCQTRQITVLASLLSLYYPVCLASKNPNESRTIMKLQNTYTRNPSERFFQSWCQEPPYSHKLQIHFPRLIWNQSKWCQGKHPKPKVTTTNHLPWNGVVKRIPWVRFSSWSWQTKGLNDNVVLVAFVKGFHNFNMFWSGVLVYIVGWVSMDWWLTAMAPDSRQNWSKKYVIQCI